MTWCLRSLQIRSLSTKALLVAHSLLHQITNLAHSMIQVSVLRQEVARAHSSARLHACEFACVHALTARTHEDTQWNAQHVPLYFTDSANWPIPVISSQSFVCVFSFVFFFLSC